jgi:hypothetical protein
MNLSEKDFFCSQPVLTSPRLRNIQLRRVASPQDCDPCFFPVYQAASEFSKTLLLELFTVCPVSKKCCEKMPALTYTLKKTAGKVFNA